MQYYGSISVGVSGDVTHIEHAVSAVLSQNREPVTVTLVTGEIGVQALLKSNRKASAIYFVYHMFLLVTSITCIG